MRLPLLLKRIAPYLFLLFIPIALLVTNTEPGKYLSGWDNLQGELYPELNIKRAIFSVWQEYQSFGLLAGLAHAADLPRMLFIFVLSWITPNWLIRTLFHLGMIALGGIGIYRFFRNYAFAGRSRWYPLLAALFYQLNFGTIQIFYIPLESFSTFFGFLPWLVMLAYRFLNPKLPLQTQFVLLTLIVNWLATPLAHVQTMFIVYGLTLVGFIGVTFWKERRKWKLILGRGVLFTLVIVSANAYWLFPQAYFAKSFRNVVDYAKINQIATENVFLENVTKGTYHNFITFEGFYYDQFDVDRTYLFQTWKNYKETFVIEVVTFSIAFIVLAGLLNNRSPLHWHFVTIYIICACALITNQPPFSWINEFIRENGFISQVFRSPFTKFIIVYGFVGSYLFAAGIQLVHRYTHRYSKQLLTKKGIVTWMAASSFALLLMIQSFPAFQGYFFSPRMRVTIPSRYFELMDYFRETDTNRRIALLPDFMFWGWFNYSWGYYGSGFLWYGIEQPIVSRTFDVWNEKSEGYFWEVKHAMHSANATRLEELADKYGIDYFLFDETMLPLNKATTSKQYAHVRQILSTSKRIKAIKRWDKLILYQIQPKIPRDSFITTATNLPNIGPLLRMTDDDMAYQSMGTYKTDTSKPYNRYYPFLDLMTLTRQPEQSWEIKEFPDSFQVQRELPFDPAEYQYEDASPSASILNGMNRDMKYLYTATSSSFSDSWLYISFPKVNLVNFDTRNTEVNNCGFGKNDVQARTDDKGIQVRAFNSSTACFWYVAQFPKEPSHFLLTVESKNWQGQPLFFYALDGTKEESIVEDRIRSNPDYFILTHYPNVPREFSINFQGNSYGNYNSNNELNTVRLEYFPLDVLKKIHFIGTYLSGKTSYTEPENVTKHTYASYTIPRAEAYAGSTVLLYQSFHPGWEAYLNGTKLDTHVPINNWANGWELPLDTPADSTLEIVFWPQYLQFIGFGIGGAALTILLIATALRRKNFTRIPHHQLHNHH